MQAGRGRIRGKRREKGGEGKGGLKGEGEGSRRSCKNECIAESRERARSTGEHAQVDSPGGKAAGQAGSGGTAVEQEVWPKE